MSRVALIFSLTVACDPPVDDDRQPAHDDRSPTGKADGAGSCLVDAQPQCGEQSVTGCWCDDFCEAIGDCCADKRAVCDGEVEPVWRVRMPSRVPANGASVPIFVDTRVEDPGSFIVRTDVSRSDAGRPSPYSTWYKPQEVVDGWHVSYGRSSWLTACDVGEDPGCLLGPATISLMVKRAGGEEELVVEHDIEIVEPDEDAAAAPCTDVGNVAVYKEYVNGWGAVGIPARLTLSQGSWEAYHVARPASGERPAWEVVTVRNKASELRTFELSHEQLEPRTYESVQLGFSSWTGAVSLSRANCLQRGSMTIHALELGPPSHGGNRRVDALTASWEFECKGGANGVPHIMNGCVHYERDALPIEQ